MKKVLLWAALAVLCAAILVGALVRLPHQWKGVDESVVERFAEEAGRPPRDPYINTDKGDLLLFFFLIAGAAGGFVGGYCFRELFPPQKKA